MPNLASRALALCQARLLADWQAAYGHPQWIAAKQVERQATIFAVVTLKRAASLPPVHAVVAAFKLESQRQKELIRKAKICESRLLFIHTAFSKLLTDEQFLTVLRAEALDKMPEYLWAKLKPAEVV